MSEIISQITISEDEINFIKKRRLIRAEEMETIKSEKVLKKQKHMNYPELYNNYIEKTRNLKRFEENFKEEKIKLEKDLDLIKKELQENCCHYQPIKGQAVSNYEGYPIYTCVGCDKRITPQRKQDIKGMEYYMKGKLLKTWNNEKFDDLTDDEEEI